MLSKLAAKGRPAGLVLEGTLFRLEEEAEAEEKCQEETGFQSLQATEAAMASSARSSPRSVSGGSGSVDSAEAVVMGLLEEATQAAMAGDGPAAHGHFMAAEGVLASVLREQGAGMGKARREKLEAMAASCKERATIFA